MATNLKGGNFMAKREMKTQTAEEVKVEQAVASEPVVEEKKDDKKGSVEKGIVVDCTRLNIRKEPKKDASVVLLVDAGAELSIIDSDKAKGDWYKVITANKVHGFCMKKYVKLK
jgi:uncharacterized protein YgiM (DUF1202 family)